MPDYRVLMQNLGNADAWDPITIGTWDRAWQAWAACLSYCIPARIQRLWYRLNPAGDMLEMHWVDVS